MNPLLVLLKKQPVRILMYVATGILIGSWLGNQYPAQTASFWGQPIVALVTAIAGLWASIQNNKDTASKIEEALNTIPPGKTVCSCEPGEKQP